MNNRTGTFCAALLLAGCAQAASTDAGPDPFRDQRLLMVQYQVEGRGIADTAVIRAMREIPRHRFVPGAEMLAAYEDFPLPIGHEQTISQPYIVAYMTEAADVGPTDKVLEIGTGSGYQAAVLGEVARAVYTVEIIPELAERARATLAALGYRNVQVRTGNGYLGWPEQAPFDAIVVTAAPDQVPRALVDQLAVGGRLVIPVGDPEQQMRVITRTEGGVLERATIPVRFVPMTGIPKP